MYNPIYHHCSLSPYAVAEKLAEQLQNIESTDAVRALIEAAIRQRDMEWFSTLDQVRSQVQTVNNNLQHIYLP